MKIVFLVLVGIPFFFSSMSGYAETSSVEIWTGSGEILVHNPGAGTSDVFPDTRAVPVGATLETRTESYVVLKLEHSVHVLVRPRTRLTVTDIDAATPEPGKPTPRTIDLRMQGDQGGIFVLVQDRNFKNLVRLAGKLGTSAMREGIVGFRNDPEPAGVVHAISSLNGDVHCTSPVFSRLTVAQGHQVTIEEDRAQVLKMTEEAVIHLGEDLVRLAGFIGIEVDCQVLRQGDGSFSVQVTYLPTGEVFTWGTPGQGDSTGQSTDPRTQDAASRQRPGTTTSQPQAADDVAEQETATTDSTGIDSPPEAAVTPTPSAPESQ